MDEPSVPDNPPEHLMQGLFNQAGTYPVFARLANVPGKVITNTGKTQRALAVEITGVRDLC